MRASRGNARKYQCEEGSFGVAVKCIVLWHRDCTHPGNLIGSGDPLALGDCCRVSNKRPQSMFETRPERDDAPAPDEFSNDNQPRGNRANGQRGLSARPFSIPPGNCSAHFRRNSVSKCRQCSSGCDRTFIQTQPSLRRGRREDNRSRSGWQCGGRLDQRISDCASSIFHHIQRPIAASARWLPRLATPKCAAVTSSMPQLHRTFTFWTRWIVLGIHWIAEQTPGVPQLIRAYESE